MLNTVYRLVAPRRFEVAFNDIDLNGEVIYSYNGNSIHENVVSSRSAFFIRK